METLLNQRFDIYLTGKIVKNVIESYKIETRDKMKNVMDELKQQYNKRLNKFYDSDWGYSEDEYDKELLTMPFLTHNKYRKSWVKCDYGEINITNNDWRDNVFTDKLRNILRRNTIKNLRKFN